MAMISQLVSFITCAYWVIFNWYLVAIDTVADGNLDLELLCQ